MKTSPRPSVEQYLPIGLPFWSLSPVLYPFLLDSIIHNKVLSIDLIYQVLGLISFWNSRSIKGMKFCL